MTGPNHQARLSKEEIDSVISLYSNGEYQKAIDRIKSLNKVYPNVPLLFNLVGACYKALGQLEASVKMFETAVNIKPDYAEAHNNLGNAFKDLGRFDDAVNSYQKAIEIKPEFAEAHNNLGNAFKDLGRFDDAVNSYQKSIYLNKDISEIHYNLGLVFKKLNRLDAAIKSFLNALNLNPTFSEALNNLGICYALFGKSSLAIDCFQSAINVDQNYADPFNNLGNSLISLGKFKAAIKCFEKAIEIDSNFTEAHNSLGNAFKKLKKRQQALVQYEKAYSINPDLSYLLGNILNAKMHLCFWDNLQQSIVNLIEKVINNNKVVEPFNLMSLIDSPAVQRSATVITAKLDYPKLNYLPSINPYPKHQKIRIGYFSADFRDHPVAYLTAELYEVHNRDHFEIHAFSFGPDIKDQMNLRIKAGVDHFHEVRSKSHKEIVELSRSLEIDIAIDLSGFTANARTDIFAMSAAPIQLSYIGYLGTMGADYYDYLIADPIMIPKENQKHYVEKIVYLPCFQVNDSTELPPKINLTRQDLGLPAKGFIFCCFNNTYKFTPTTFDSWSRILKQVEGSVLIVFANNELSKTNLTKEIIKRGIDSKRLIFGDSLDRPEYLARYRTADLFLDTQPYNAGTTASDALRMGLPMLTLKGESYQARMGASIVNALGLPELITNTAEEYESLAIELAKNPDKLKAIKDKLEANLSTAPLYNTKLFAKSIETAYTKMYERHHQGLEPDHIYIEHFK
jgi:predicted O-linked N-acetylglucosamine transferase (SPINDLY family)